MKTAPGRAELNEVTERLQPDASRRWALVRLEEMFRAGAPVEDLDGPTTGRLLTTSVSGPLDGFVRRIARLYMPWLGKSFDAAAGTGINLLRPSARTPMKMLWPSYEPVATFADRIEAFPFRTRLAPGELDLDVKVLKIDYDFEANPQFVIRRILDELVSLGDGMYLGKILFRTSARWNRIGFFSLER